eukprot:scaffold119625_cov18-Tisochrysis_lutea.AAC.2
MSVLPSLGSLFFGGRAQVSFDESVVKGRHVLLVDDLCDSGLTMSEVHRLVQEAGAASECQHMRVQEAGTARVRR